MPCFHLIAERVKPNQNNSQNQALLHLEDFLPRWRHNTVNPVPIFNTSITYEPISTSEPEAKVTCPDYEYGNNISKVEVLFGAAQKDEKARKIVDWIEVIDQEFARGAYFKSENYLSRIFSPEIIGKVEKRNESVHNCDEIHQDESDSQQNNIAFPFHISGPSIFSVPGAPFTHPRRNVHVK